MNDIRLKFEEIWPVPEGVGWGDRTNCYFAWYPIAQEDAIAHTARLDTFTRCQESMGQKVVLAVRDVCELDPADSGDPECICIKASDLGAILSKHFEGIE